MAMAKILWVAGEIRTGFFVATLQPTPRPWRLRDLARDPAAARSPTETPAVRF